MRNHRKRLKWLFIVNSVSLFIVVASTCFLLIASKILFNNQYLMELSKKETNVVITSLLDILFYSLILFSLLLFINIFFLWTSSIIQTRIPERNPEKELDTYPSDSNGVRRTNIKWKRSEAVGLRCPSVPLSICSCTAPRTLPPSVNLRRDRRTHPPAWIFNRRGKV